MKITFLGTSSMLPTKDRNPTAILISYKDENILIDCGEGTQRQLRLKRIPPTKITKLLITHWHGDHILGIPGFIQSLGWCGRKRTLDVYGPKGTKKYFYNMFKSFANPARVRLNIKEISNGKFFENKDFELHCIKLNHNTPCLGYSIKEKDKRKINLAYTKKFGLTRHPLLGKLQKGRSIIYRGKRIPVNKATKLIKGKKVTVIVDTELCNNAIKLAKYSNLLIAEATWLVPEHKKNRDYKHLTIKDTLKLAKKAKVKQLILTHFSQRYKNTKEYEKDIKKQFRKTKFAKDFMEVTV